MKNLEKYALLALSLILVSSYSISCALPNMREYFKGLPAERIDLLISVPSFSIMAAIFLTIIFSKYINERKVIIGGLILYSLSGILPFFIHEYMPFLLSRICMGFGSGLVNSQAISVISKRYRGLERTRLLGYRGSVEAVGNAMLTMLAGLLLTKAWTNVFLIYGIGFIILIIYLLGVSKDTSPEETEEIKTQVQKLPLTKKDSIFAIINALFAFLIIGSNVVLSLRIPVLMIERGIGTDAQSSYVLTTIIIASILSNLIYSKEKEVLKGWFNILFVFLTALGIFGVSYSQNIFLLLSMAFIYGFSYAVLVTDIFSRVSINMPEAHVTRVTNMVLTGCNMGAFLATYAIKLINSFFHPTEAPALVYGAFFAAIFLVLLLGKFRKQD